MRFPAGKDDFVLEIHDQVGGYYGRYSYPKDYFRDFFVSLYAFLILESERAQPFDCVHFFSFLLLIVMRIMS